jgi:hypothetical protein
MKKTFWSWLGDIWCKLMHRAVTWPVHGHYHCRVCWREYPISWEVAPVASAADASRVWRSEDPQMGSDRIVREAPSW